MTVTPASRVKFPIVAVARTTALALSASLGGVTRKVATGAVPGATEVNSVGPVGTTVHPPPQCQLDIWQGLVTGRGQLHWYRCGWRNTQAPGALSMQRHILRGNAECGKAKFLYRQVFSP